MPGAPSMWFFIVGDLIIFGIYFVGYMVSRGEHQALFLEGQQQLNQGIGVFNTILLLTSSLFIAHGTLAARAGSSREAWNLFRIGFAFGAAFPVLKLFEWGPKISAGLTPGTDLFFMYYYVLTGLHLCHLLLGLVILGFVLRELKVAKAPSIQFVETGAIYWHMVDLLWLVVFALCYLMR